MIRHSVMVLIAIGQVHSHVRAASPVDFSREVRPILESRCFDCHGAIKQKSGLRLDSRAGVLEGGDFGPALIPGNPTKSHLIELISSHDENERMPPEGDALTPNELDVLKRWIAEGAVWPGEMDATVVAKKTNDHWSFQPVATAFAHDSLDGFIRVKLAEKGLEPSPEADPSTLIRRMTLGLTGLPPTPEEVEDFVAACRSDSTFIIRHSVVSALADRLLASPRYGERWAQPWLDVIRYADTRGYEFNSIRENAWPFRDWVIAALNRDLPYDQFLFQQLAGDTVDQDPATGFLVTAPLPTLAEVGEEPVARKQARFNSLDEVVQNVGNGMLGLTVSCARCHNHKFDPISQRDYYRMTATFAGVAFEDRPWRKESEKPRLAELAQAEARAAFVRQELRDFPSVREHDQGKYSDHFRPVEARRIRLTVTATDAEDSPVAFDGIEAFTAADGGIVPQQVASKNRGNPTVTTSDSHVPHASNAALIVDAEFGKNSQWVSLQGRGTWVEIEFRQPHRIDHIRWSRNRTQPLREETADGRNLASRWRIEAAGESGAWQTLADEERWDGLSAAEAARRLALEQEINELNVRLIALRRGPQVFAGRFMAQPDAMHVLMRGDPEEPREAVGAGAVEILGGEEMAIDTPESARRVAFARWVASPENPLTARVAVNRLWQHHFGVGLVDTPGDFGAVGSRPTHPELLDWLTRELVTKGWSLKAVHRLIVTSATYRQSSRPVETALRIDPESRLLGRFPPHRLDAETIRDSMLAVSGSLDLKMGGPGVNIYGPKGAFDEWKPKDDPGPASWRRMIYLAKMRGSDDGMFKAFDLPDCGQVVTKRGKSTTPLQALNLLNGRFTIEQSRRLANRIVEDVGGDPTRQIERLFLLTLARPPRANELAACLATIQADEFSTVCRALLNSNEFLFLP